MQLLTRRVKGNGPSALMFLWFYTAEFHVNGILEGMNEEKIEMAANWFGEPGTLVPMLLELGWLGQMNDGTYFIPEWRETNSWAANADNRSAIGRLNGMATHYPELHQQLVERGATGITADAYARITSEYNKNGIIQSSSIVTAEILQNLANCTTPAPAPAPIPSPAPMPVPTPNPIPTPGLSPEREAVSAVTAATDFSSRTGKTKTRSAKKRSDTAQAVETAHVVLENLPISGEYPATAQAVVALWNAKLAPAGFTHAVAVTPQRIKNFKSCAKYIPESGSMSFWHGVFEKMLASEYMCNAAKEKASWTGVDWILSPSNLAKVLEGNYDNDRKPKTTAKKNTAHAATVNAETAPKPEQKPIELPAETLELHAKIQAMPELTFEDYLHMKFPEAEEEELHRDTFGVVHTDYSDLPDVRRMKKAFEVEKTCALCTDPKHCKLSEEMKSVMRVKSDWLTVALRQNEHGETYLGTKFVRGLTCKHKCANCPSCVSEQAEKMPSDVAEESTQHREAIPMPAKVEELTKPAEETKSAETPDFASALGMRVSFDDEGDVTSSPKPKKESKPSTWEADPYELEVIERDRKIAEYQKYLREQEAANEAIERERRIAEYTKYLQAQKEAEESKARAEITSNVPEETDDTAMQDMNNADYWDGWEEEYREIQELRNQMNEEAGDDSGDIAG